jgi:hypothetical protein
VVSSVDHATVAVDGSQPHQSSGQSGLDEMMRQAMVTVDGRLRRQGVRYLRSDARSTDVFAKPEVTRRRMVGRCATRLVERRWGNRSHRPGRLRGICRIWALSLMLSAVMMPAVGSAAPKTTDARATRIYLVASYRLARSEWAAAARSEAQVKALVRRVRKTCAGAARGEPAAVDKQGAEIDQELLGAVLVAGDTPNRRAAKRFIRAAGRLHWRDAKVERAVQAYLRTVKIESSLRAPDICADVRAWKASGFKTVPARTTRFTSRVAAAASGAQRVPPRLFAPYETPRARALPRRTEALEKRLASRMGLVSLEAAGEIGDVLA